MKYFTYTLLIYVFSFGNVHSADYNFPAVENIVDIEHLTKSAVARMLSYNPKCTRRTKISDIKRFELLERKKSDWYNDDTGERGHQFKSVFYIEHKQFKANTVVILTNSQSQPKGVATVPYFELFGHSENFKNISNHSCKGVRKLHASASDNMESVLKIRSQYVEDIYVLSKMKNYRGEKLVFQAQNILAGSKFELLGASDVDGISGSKTLEAFGLFNNLIDEPIKFDGKTFTKEVVAQMKEAYKNYH